MRYAEKEFTDFALFQILSEKKKEWEDEKAGFTYVRCFRDC